MNQDNYYQPPGRSHAYHQPPHQRYVYDTVYQQSESARETQVRYPYMTSGPGYYQPMQANGQYGHTMQKEMAPFYPYEPVNQSYQGAWQTEEPMQQTAQPVSPYEYFKKPELENYWQSYAQAVPAFASQKQPVTKGLVSYFQDKDGQMDINKMMSTVGQMATTVQQVSPIVKSLGSFLKVFR